MTDLSWSEWDGRGFDEAFAYALGTWRVEEMDEIVKHLYRLGIEFPREKSLELVHGYVGSEGDDPVLDACDSEGAAMSGDGTYLDSESVRPATFAIFVDWD